jgi:hypothetical protein
MPEFGQGEVAKRSIVVLKANNTKEKSTEEKARELQRCHSEDILKPRPKLAKAAGVKSTSEILIGDVAATIVRYAEEKGCDAILMGTRGMSAIGNPVMGSERAESLIAARMVAVPDLLWRYCAVRFLARPIWWRLSPKRPSSAAECRKAPLSGFRSLLCGHLAEGGHRLLAAQL